MTALEAAKNYKVLFFLADNSIGINVDVSAQRWVSVIAAQEFKELYLKSYARVVPKDAIQEIISQKVYNYFQELVPNQMQFETFYTLAEARDWLQVQERVENSKL